MQNLSKTLRQISEKDSSIKRKIKESMISKIQKDIYDLVKQVDPNELHEPSRNATERIGKQVGLLVFENLEYFQRLTEDAVDEYVIAKLAEDVVLGREITGC